ncbi:leucine-rich repeat protein 1-like [Zingiber officinale]|uniref:leucine-rich repeat protein 1-like n=1 Tax=Zingiber officinale TaxID=94328 RepID=UPI001C4CC324|nr:leucine-rich repeat protein 1-like [Zingiber officinale]
MVIAGDVATGILVVALSAAFLLSSLVSSNSDADALAVFRQSLSDPGGKFDSWDPTLDTPCTWFHITCNQENRVTRVDLGHSNLSGHLVPELGNIEFLQFLELHHNNIQGTIPVELGNLKNLVDLSLNHNSFSGVIPPTLGNLKNLLSLRLNDNHLTGHVPRAILENHNIKVLNVSNNDLSGPIPTTGPFEPFSLNKYHLLLNLRKKGLIMVDGKEV